MHVYTYIYIYITSIRTQMRKQTACGTGIQLPFWIAWPTLESCRWEQSRWFPCVWYSMEQKRNTYPNLHFSSLGWWWAVWNSMASSPFFARPAQWKHAAFSYTNNAHWKQPHGHSKWDNFVFLLLLQHDMSMKFQDPSVVFFIGHMVAYVSHCSAAVSGRRGPGGFTNRQRCTKLSGVNIQS